MINLSYQKGLALPGGGIEEGETCQEALKREIKEETGLQITKITPLGNYTSKKDVYSTLHFCFLVTTKNSNIVESAEGKPVWIKTKKALRQCVYKDEQEAIKDFLKQKMSSQKALSGTN